MSDNYRSRMLIKSRTYNTIASLSKPPLAYSSRYDYAGTRSGILTSRPSSGIGSYSSLSNGRLYSMLSSERLNDSSYDSRPLSRQKSFSDMKMMQRNISSDYRSNDPPANSSMQRLNDYRRQEVSNSSMAAAPSSQIYERPSSALATESPTLQSSTMMKRDMLMGAIDRRSTPARELPPPRPTSRLGYVSHTRPWLPPIRYTVNDYHSIRIRDRPILSNIYTSLQRRESKVVMPQTRERSSRERSQSRSRQGSVEDKVTVSRYRTIKFRENNIGSSILNRKASVTWDLPSPPQNISPRSTVSSNTTLSSLSPTSMDQVLDDEPFTTMGECAKENCPILDLVQPDVVLESERIILPPEDEPKIECFPESISENPERKVAYELHQSDSLKCDTHQPINDKKGIHEDLAQPDSSSGPVPVRDSDKPITKKKKKKVVNKSLSKQSSDEGDHAKCTSNLSEIPSSTSPGHQVEKNTPSVTKNTLLEPLVTASNDSSQVLKPESEKTSLIKKIDPSTHVTGDPSLPQSRSDVSKEVEKKGEQKKRAVKEDTKKQEEEHKVKSKDKSEKELPPVTTIAPVTVEEYAPVEEEASKKKKEIVFKNESQSLPKSGTTSFKKAMPEKEPANEVTSNAIPTHALDSAATSNQISPLIKLNSTPCPVTSQVVVNVSQNVASATPQKAASQAAMTSSPASVPGVKDQPRAKLVIEHTLESLAAGEEMSVIVKNSSRYNEKLSRGLQQSAITHSKSPPHTSPASVASSQLGDEKPPKSKVNEVINSTTNSETTPTNKEMVKVPAQKTSVAKTQDEENRAIKVEQVKPDDSKITKIKPLHPFTTAMPSVSSPKTPTSPPAQSALCPSIEPIVTKIEKVAPQNISSLGQVDIMHKEEVVSCKKPPILKLVKQDSIVNGSSLPSSPFQTQKYKCFESFETKSQPPSLEELKNRNKKVSSLSAPVSPASSGSQTPSSSTSSTSSPSFLKHPQTRTTASTQRFFPTSASQINGDVQMKLNEQKLAMNGEHYANKSNVEVSGQRNEELKKVDRDENDNLVQKPVTSQEAKNEVSKKGNSTKDVEAQKVKVMPGKEVPPTQVQNGDSRKEDKQPLAKPGTNLTEQKFVMNDGLAQKKNISLPGISGKETEKSVPRSDKHVLLLGVKNNLQKHVEMEKNEMTVNHATNISSEKKPEASKPPAPLLVEKAIVTDCLKPDTQKSNAMNVMKKPKEELEQKSAKLLPVQIVSFSIPLGMTTSSVPCPSQISNTQVSAAKKELKSILKTEKVVKPTSKDSLDVKVQTGNNFPVQLPPSPTSIPAEITSAIMPPISITNVSVTKTDVLKSSPIASKVSSPIPSPKVAKKLPNVMVTTQVPCLSITIAQVDDSHVVVPAPVKPPNDLVEKSSKTIFSPKKESLPKTNGTKDTNVLEKSEKECKKKDSSINGPEQTNGIDKPPVNGLSEAVVEKPATAKKVKKKVKKKTNSGDLSKEAEKSCKQETKSNGTSAEVADQGPKTGIDPLGIAPTPTIEAIVNGKNAHVVPVSTSLKREQEPDKNESKAPKRIRFRKYCLDDFNLLNVLGRGSFGKVFLAELKDHGVYFAIKCMKKHSVIEDDDVESTMIERRVLALGFVHPFICKLFCTFQTKSYLCFVMEYLCGGDLMFHVQKFGRMTEDRARFYASEVVCALKFLHKRAIIYRDLKLDNIVLDSEGHIRLVDFGMCQCKIYREDCLPSNFCGTPEYMAPEIIKGVKYNHLVDWWSFGVLLYEMVVGRCPFTGSDEDELLWNVCHEKVTYPKFMSNECKNLIQLFLEKVPDNRLGSTTCPAGDVMNQPFFADTFWELVERKKLRPPYKPEVDNPRDISNFDTEFTDAAPQLTPVDELVDEKIDHELFQGFSYTNPNMTSC